MSYLYTMIFLTRISRFFTVLQQRVINYTACYDITIFKHRKQYTGLLVPNDLEYYVAFGIEKEY